MSLHVLHRFRRRWLIGSVLLCCVFVFVCRFAFPRTPQSKRPLSLASSRLAQRQVFQDHILDLSFSPDGKRLFAASNDTFGTTTAKILDARSLKVLKNFALGKAARNVVLTPDWKRFVVCDEVPGPAPYQEESSYRLRLFDRQSGKLLQTKNGSTGNV